MNSFLNIQVRVIVADARRALALIRKDLGNLPFGNAQNGARGFKNAWNSMGIARMGSQAQWLGRQIEYNFTVPLLLAGGAAVKMALANEKAFTRLEKVYGDGAHDVEFYRKEVDALGRAFVALSNHFGVAQKDVINIAADWAAAGASGLALAKSVELTLKTMVLGELEAAEATKALIAIQAQYGFNIKQLTESIEILNMVENQTGASMADLITGFSRVAGVARAGGVTVRELAADIAALVPATGSAANAGNALKTIFSRLTSVTPEISAALKKLGIETSSFSWQSLNAQEKLKLVAESFKGLSGAQKNYIATIIASRYQVNRFKILMQELTNEFGYYSRAMNSTADAEQVFNQAQKELERVLKSNPQRLKVLWTMLQNAMTEVIIPMIPLVLWLASVLQKLVQGFSDLNPGVQKFILFSLALLAAVGPVVRILGAFQVLLFELSRMALVALVPIRLLITALGFLIKLPLRALHTVYVAVFHGMIQVTKFTALTVIATGKGMWVSLVAIWRAGAVALSAFSLFGWGAIAYGFKNALDFMRIRAIVWFGAITRIWLPLVAAWRLVINNIINITVYGWPYIVMLWKTGMTALLASQRVWLSAFVLMWKFATTSPVQFMRNMWVVILMLQAKALPTLRALGTAITAALTGPWGAAAVAIITILILFWDEIKQFFSNLMTFVRQNSARIGAAFAPLGRAAVAVRNAVVRAFNALPDGIRNALLAVVRIIRAAAMQVYEWFSYLNPWARHSPSLVENVTTGVAEIHRQYAGLGDVGAAFGQAADDLDLFAAAVLRINRSAEANKYAEIRKLLMSLARDAVGPFDRLVRELRALEDQLREVEKAVKAQENITEALKDQLDSANKALETQEDILRNMREEADDYREVINKINGDLEVLRGTREALRNAGAGSDILGTYDDQIAALEAQKEGINQQLDAAELAYQQQKALVEQLTAARDALQDSYDLEREKLEDLRDRYDEIHDRIQAITSAINDFATAAESLKNAGKGTEDLFAAGAGADFPDPGGAGKIGREGTMEDQQKLIDEFTAELGEKSKNLFGLFDFLEPIKKGWNTAVTWLKENVGPALGIVWEGITTAVSKIPNPFKGLEFGGFLDTLKDMGKTVLGVFESIWRLIGPPLTEIKNIIFDAFGRAFEEIGPELRKFKDLVGPMGEMFSNLWTVLKPVAAIVGGVLLLAFNVLANVLANVLKPVLNWIIDLIKSIIKIFRGLIEFIVGVFTGDWELAWTGIKDFFGGIWDAVWSTIKNAGLLIWGVVSGIVEGIVKFFTWLWDELVGHSIVPDIVNGILYWFQLMWKGVQYIWDKLVQGLQWAWENILKPVFDFFSKAILGLKIVAAQVFDWLKKGWDGLVNIFKMGKDKLLEYVDGMVKKFTSFIDFLKGLPGKVTSATSTMWNGLTDKFKGAINALISGWNKLDFGIHITIPDWVPGVGGKGFNINDIFPDIPLLARGGMIANQATAIVGEGRPGFPEYVIPTDPIFRKRALGLFQGLAQELGLGNAFGSNELMTVLATQLARGTSADKAEFMASGGILGSTRIRNASRGGIVIAPVKKETHNHFYGDLSFPNIKDGGDAEEFLKNLEALLDED